MTLPDGAEWLVAEIDLPEGKTVSVKARVRSRLPSPQILATASVVLSYRTDSGTPPKKPKPDT